MYVTNGYFVCDDYYKLRTSGWFHVALVYHGPNDGEGITVYHDGTQVEHDDTRYNRSYTTGPGSMVIGRKYTNRDDYYTSVVVDELTMWNRQLSVQEIQDIFNLY